MRDIVEFFEDITSLKPNRNQKKFLREVIKSKDKWFLLSCGRGTGKTLCVAIIICWYIFEYAPEMKKSIRALIVTPQSPQLYDYLTLFLGRNPDWLSKIKEGMKGLYEPIPLLRFKLKDNSEVRITRRATDLEIRGFQGDLVVIDEAAQVRDSIVTAALGCVTGDLSLRILLSTPTPTKNTKFLNFVKYFKRKGWKLFSWSELDCDWISEGDIKKKKKNMSKEEFRYEVLGKVPKKSKYLFHYALARALSKNPPIPETGPIVGALDISFGRQNACALLLMQKIGTVRKVVYAKKWPGKKLREILPTIQDLLDSYKVSKLKIDSRPVDLSKEAYNSLEVKEKMQFNQQGRKESMAMHALREMSKGRVEISEEHKDFIKELKTYYLRKIHGRDLVDCFLMALYNEPDEESSGTVAWTSKKERNKRKFLSMH